MNGTKAAAYSLDWAKRDVVEIKCEYVVTCEYKIVERQFARYYNLGQLVINQGGWDDRAVVMGSFTVVSRCIVMGQPWTKKAKPHVNQ